MALKQNEVTTHAARNDGGDRNGTTTSQEETCAANVYNSMHADVARIVKFKEGGRLYILPDTRKSFSYFTWSLVAGIIAGTNYVVRLVLVI